MNDDEDPAFEALLEYIRDHRGFDFTGYKRTTLRRRISKRMREVGVGDVEFAAYQDYLEVHPEEFSQLFNTILINVTGFLRDRANWDYLAREVIPQLVGSNHGPLRVWCAGCASGEEAYTVAMLLAEQLGEDAFRERVKIYATDVDDDALATARHAVYSSSDLEPVPAEWRQRYLEPSGSRFVFRAGVRRALIFGRHDVVRDAPISRLDLLVCRNLLMYFNRDTQARIAAQLHYALKPSGFLFVGKAEMLLTQGDLFQPVSMQHRVFGPQHTQAGGLFPTATPPGDRTRGRQVLRDAAFTAAQIPQIVVDTRGRLVLANDEAKSMFGLGAHDIGHDFRDLELSYRPVELRSRIEQVSRERRAIQLRRVERHVTQDETQQLEVWITPLLDPDDAQVLGVGITFQDVTHTEQLKAQLSRANQELETAYEELQSTNEELETTNEELHSTIEELETTNEELQSSNEELETMNEELQSTNAEHEEINRLLSARSQELDRTNAYLHAILSSVAVGIVVVDGDGIVRLWNDRSFDLWGLREDEVDGQPLANLDMGLPTAPLVEAVTACRQTGETREVTVDAVTRRGREVSCTARVRPLRAPGQADAVHGVVVVVEARPRPSESDPGREG